MCCIAVAAVGWQTMPLPCWQAQAGLHAKSAAQMVGENLLTFFFCGLRKASHPYFANASMPHLQHNLLVRSCLQFATHMPEAFHLWFACLSMPNLQHRWVQRFCSLLSLICISVAVPITSAFLSSPSHIYPPSISKATQAYDGDALFSRLSRFFGTLNKQGFFRQGHVWTRPVSGCNAGAAGHFGRRCRADPHVQAVQAQVCVLLFTGHLRAAGPDACTLAPSDCISPGRSAAHQHSRYSWSLCSMSCDLLSQLRDKKLGPLGLCQLHGASIVSNH